MTDNEYVERLQRHLADYKVSVLRVEEAGTWGNPPRPYPHILPRERRGLNIVAPFARRSGRRSTNAGGSFTSTSTTCLPRRRSPSTSSFCFIRTCRMTWSRPVKSSV